MRPRDVVRSTVFFLLFIGARASLDSTELDNGYPLLQMCKQQCESATSREACEAKCLEDIEKDNLSEDRLGTNHHLEPWYKFSEINGQRLSPHELENFEKQNTRSVRSTTGRERRAASFVRIGKSELANSHWADDDSDALEEDNSIYENMKRAVGGKTWQRRAGSFLRIGKSVEPEDEKRAFVRIGKSADEDEKRAFVRIGKRASFVRIGKSSDVDDKRASFVRIGKSSDVDEKRASFVRIGKSLDEKRGASFVRIGKSPDTDEKRASFVRIGKSDPLADQLTRVAKAASFVRIGKSIDTEYDNNKRAASFVRIG